jgi:co-chaperonin GroES (HSP10)
MNHTQFKPTKNNILLKKIRIERETETGIVLMETDFPRHFIAQIVAVGTLDDNVDPFEPGQVVVVRDGAELINFSDGEFFQVKPGTIVGWLAEGQLEGVVS